MYICNLFDLYVWIFKFYLGSRLDPTYCSLLMCPKGYRCQPVVVCGQGDIELQGELSAISSQHSERLENLGRVPREFIA